MKYLSAILIMLLLSVAMVGAQAEWTAEEVVAVLEVMMDDPQFRAELINLIVAHWPASEGSAPVTSAVIDMDYILALFEDGGDEAVRELYGLSNPPDGDTDYCSTVIDLGLSEFSDLADRMKMATRFVNNCLAA